MERVSGSAVLLDREIPVPGLVAQVVTMLNGHAQRASLPVRTARLLQRSRAHTPSPEVGAGGAGGAGDGSASPAAPASLLQDVVDIKTLLLQLKRVLHEPGEEHHSKSSETLDPLVLACAENPARGNGRRLPPHTPADSPLHLHPEHTADLKRQILYLQSQVEERDRLVRVLQQQMCKLSEGGAPGEVTRHSAGAVEDTCNVATQTDRLRPPVTSNLTNTESSGLVSWNEVNGRKLSTYSEAQKTKRAVANGTGPVKCVCGARRANGQVNGSETDNVGPHLKTNSRVGSRYLQAITTKEQPEKAKRDLSVNERLLRKNALSCSRSRSIENFQNQNLSIEKRIDNRLNYEIKHHTSYSDLYCGKVGKELKANGHSPVQNGQSAESDYSSDGGYKSLPSSINCNGNSPRKTSGIPRRSIESRLFPAKPLMKASAI